MGWLRDLMGTCEPKVQSYGELARQCLEHHSWPADIQPQPRSLASLYSKFDRGIEVEWLHDRPEVQLVLAAVLKLPVTALATEVKKRVSSADVQLNRWRPKDLVLARAMDLREEPLPSIFPEKLLRPGLWRLEWWRNGANQGGELLGRWLEARALAEFAVCVDQNELRQRLAIGTAPLFVLYYGFDAHALGLSSFGRRPVCVAALDARCHDDFVLVESSPFRDVEKTLLSWLEGLLPAREDVEITGLGEWVRHWTSEGLELDFDTVTGLVGLAHQLGLRGTERSSLESLAKQFVRLRLEQPDATETREARWIVQYGLDLPIGITKCALRRARNSPWDLPRTKAEWLELIPDEYQRGVDADWTRVSLQRAGTPLTVTELEKALTKVPPGGFRVLNALCDAQLLQEVAEGKYSLRPRWFARFLERAAYASLLEDSPEEWGQVALSGLRFAPLLAALSKELCGGRLQILDAVLELEDQDSPQSVMAIELLVLVAGRAILEGVELDAEQVQGLLTLQSEFVVEGLAPLGPPYCAVAATPPRPRLLPVNGNDALWGEWLVSLWAISEQLEQPDTNGLETINPWSQRSLLVSSSLELVAKTLAGLSADSATVPAIYSLLGRLLQHLESSAQTLDSAAQKEARAQLCASPLFGVARVLRGDGWPAWQQALTTPHGVESVKALVAAEAWPYLAKTAWRTWFERGADETAVGLFIESPLRRQLFWPYLPDRVLQGLLDARNPIALLVPEQCMKSDWVTMYLERVPEDRATAVRYLEAIPASAIVEEHHEVLFELLEAHALVDRVAPLFKEHSAAAHKRLVTLLSQGRSSPASVWLAAAPPEHYAPIFSHILERLEQHGPTYVSFEVCRAWLAELCTRRTDGWEEAYGVLGEFQKRLKRLSRAFGTASSIQDDD